MATIYAPISDSFKKDNTDLLNSITDIYEDYYKNEPFVKIRKSPPSTKHTLGSNYCHIFPTVDYNKNNIVVISCIDNLVKGAAGQAVQNMNIMCGIPEDCGITQLAMYP